MIEKLKELKRLLALFWNREHHGCPSEIVRCFEILDSLIAAAEQKPEMPKHKPDCSYEKSKGKDPIMPCTCDYTTRLEEYCQKPVCKTCDGDEIIEVDVEEVADFAKVLRGEIKK